MTSRGIHSVDTRRRELAAGVGLAALMGTSALRAQGRAPVVIGWLSNAGRDADRNQLNAFVEGMSALGWKLGEGYVLEARHADAHAERLPALAQEIALKKPAVILATLSPPARAAIAAAPTTPIVMVNGDPLASGLVASLARPGGLITGVSNVSRDTSLKAIELLVEAMPRLKRVGYLADSTNPRYAEVVSSARGAAERFRLEAVIADVAAPADIAAAIARLAKAKIQALVILPSTWFSAQLSTIIQGALAQRWPVVGNLSAIPSQGGLFAFGADTLALARRAAYYVDRILKGAPPGELPIEQPSTFRFVINLKTAKALGITISPAVRLRATEVIE
jgi:putative tryptophan/tyrosine transport system substrate-binding protein